MSISGRSEKDLLGLLLYKFQHKNVYDIVTTRNNLYAISDLLVYFFYADVKSSNTDSKIGLHIHINVCVLYSL